MKKILYSLVILMLASSFGLQNVNAQKTGDSSLLIKKVVRPVKKSNTALPQRTTSPVSLTPPKKATQTATGMVVTLKEKDLALSDIKLEKDLATGFYTISCKITNKGTAEIKMYDFSYFNCKNGTGYMAMAGALVHCDITYGSCGELSACGFDPYFILYVYKADGVTIFPLDLTTTIKPGESFIAKTPHEVQIQAPPSGCGNTVNISLGLDPLNKTGDQDTLNNALTLTTNYN